MQLLSYHAEGNVRNKILTNIAPKDYAITDSSLPSIFKVFFESGKCDFYLACNIRKLQADCIKKFIPLCQNKNCPTCLYIIRLIWSFLSREKLENWQVFKIIITAQIMKSCNEDFVSKCDKILRKHKAAKI